MTERETYSHGYGSTIVQRQETMSAECDAAFLVQACRAALSGTSPPSLVQSHAPD